MTVSVSVPATASNLGGGFDCVGVAVHKRLHVTVGITTEGPPIAIERAGTLAALDASPDDDLIVVGFRAACARAGQLRSDDELVLCITGHGLKTLEALGDVAAAAPVIEPRLREVAALAAAAGR